MDTLIIARNEYTKAKVLNTVNSIFSHEKANELADITETDGKHGIFSESLRSYYLESIAKVDGMKENNAWVKAYLIHTITSDESFKRAFKDNKDLAKELNVSASAVSNAVKAVDIREELVKNMFGNGYTLSQVQELIPEYNRHAKIKQLDVFWAGLKECGLCNTMSAKEIRNAVKEQFRYVKEDSKQEDSKQEDSKQEDSKQEDLKKAKKAGKKKATPTPDNTITSCTITVTFKGGKESAITIDDGNILCDIFASIPANLKELILNNAE